MSTESNNYRFNTENTSGNQGNRKECKCYMPDNVEMILQNLQGGEREKKVEGRISKLVSSIFNC